MVALRIGAIRLDQAIANIGDVDFRLLQILPSVRVVITMLVTAMVIMRMIVVTVFMMAVLFMFMLFMTVFFMRMIVLVMVRVVIVAVRRKSAGCDAVGGGDQWAVVVAGVNQAFHPALKQQAVEDH